jgi:dTDP-4-dehydrorhamnose reductase
MYSETSLPNPANFYSLTKLIGETIVKSLSNHLIIRTNFIGKKKWPYEKAFTDRFGTYLFADDVAIGIKEIHESKQKGIIHLVGDKIFSMYELAKITTPEIKPMTLEDYSGPHLTINMTLDSINWKKYQISKF